MAKALYDYEAATKGELSVSEGEELLVYDQEDDWLLVKTERDGGLAGYVPANYVEEVRNRTLTMIIIFKWYLKGTGEEEEETPAQNKVSQIVVPDSVGSEFQFIIPYLLIYFIAPSSTFNSVYGPRRPCRSCCEQGKGRRYPDVVYI